MEKIWCNGKYWDTNEYNRRLSKENIIDAEYDEKIALLEDECCKKIKELWK
jgi:hypothetical protein